LLLKQEHQSNVSQLNAKIEELELQLKLKADSINEYKKQIQ